MMGRLAQPSPAQERSILGYLQSHAMRAMPEGQPPQGPGAALFEQTCSRCHALPDPRQHAAAGWPAVVQRMREHMQQSNVPGISEEQADQIDGFLEREARRPH